MARKKRTDEAAAAGGAAPPSTAKQTEGMTSKSSDTKQTNDTTSGPSHRQGQQSEKGGEAASRRGGASPSSSAKKPAKDSVNGCASPTELGGSSMGQTFSEQSAGGVVALEGVLASDGQDTLLTQQRRVVDMTGLSASQKKNLKKKLRKQEQKQQEAELNSAVQVDTGATSLASHLNQVVKDWKAQLAQLETRSKTIGPGSSASQFYEAAEELTKAIKATRDEEINKAKKPIDKQATVQEIQCKIREAELAVQKNQKEVKRVSQFAPADGSSADLYAAQKKVEESVRYVLHLKEQLILTQQRKDLRAFQQSAAEIRTSVEHLIKLVQKRPPQKAVQESTNQQKEALWRKKLQALGGGPPPSGDVGSLATISISLPEHAAYILLTPPGQPSLMCRKVERKFNVLLEKKQKGDANISFIIVGYTPEACDECATFLSESIFPEIPIGFTSSPNCVSLEGQNIGAFIGSSGSNVRKLEAEHDVLLFLEDSWITVLGREAAVKKAIPHIKELNSPSSGGESGLPQSRCDFRPEIVRAMAQGSGATRAKVLDLETSFGVTIVTRPPRRTVLVRGSDAAACKKACTELEDAFKSFSCAVFDCDKSKANRLFRSAAADFSHIHGHEFISLLRCDAGVLVVGPADALPAAVEVLNGAMYQLSRASQTVEIKATELRIIDRSKRGEIETLTGATCRPPIHEGDKVTLIFSGHPDAVEKAVAMARRILVEQKEDELGCSTAAALQFLTDKSHRALEEEHGIRIRVDVPRGRLIVRGASGACEAVTEVIRRVEQEVINNGKVCTKIEVPREAVPVILGRQGANVRRIQNDCHLDNIVIDGRPDGRPQAVYMLGSQEAITQATAAVQEIVANSSGTRQQNASDGGAERRPRMGMSTTGRGGSRGGRGDYGGGTASRGKGGSSNRTAAATAAKPYNASVDDEVAFPSLGECLNRPGGRWKKAAITGNVEEGAAAKASSDLHGEVEDHGEGEFIEAGDSAN